MKTSRLLRNISFIGLLITLAVPAFAEDELPRYEVFTGFGYVRPEGGQALLKGWHTSFTSNVNNWLGIAVELSGQYGRQNLTVTSPSGRTSQVTSNVDFYSLGFGPRFTYRRNERLQPFAQVLAGISRGNWLGPAIVAGGETAFAAAIGGGFDTKFTEHIGFRIVQAEYVRTHFGAGQKKNFRIATGFLFSF